MNTGNVTLSGPFTIADDQATDEACPASAPLAPGDSVTCTASDTIDQADLDAGSLTNIATATNGSITSNSDSETVTAVQDPELTLAKTATPADLRLGRRHHQLHLSRHQHRQRHPERTCDRRR